MKLVKILSSLCLIFLIFSCSLSDLDQEASSLQDQVAGDEVTRVTGRDLRLVNAYVLSYTSNSINYRVYIQNNGTISIPLRDIVMQSYIYRPGYTNVPAGGTILGTSGYLSPGQTKVVNWSCSLTINLLQQTVACYLKAMVDPSNNIPEVYESNNIYYRRFR
jgi:hypothetical protein